jgi:serine/threonine-protein kinase
MTARLADSRLTIIPELHPGYRLRRLRGVGGFGEVWEAEKVPGGAPVALKFLPRAGAGGAKQELRSIQVVQEAARRCGEVAAWSGDHATTGSRPCDSRAETVSQQGEEACHAHLIRIERVWCAEGFLVVAMELADGSLADLLDVYFTEFETALPPGHVLPLLAQAADALDFLNNARHLIHGEWVTVQHCDVTVRNLLVFGKTVKLSDFGLTTTLAGRQKVHRRSGTPAYAAPEVFQGYLSNRTDQYALAVCYCLLRSGQFPFADTPSDFQSDYTRPTPDLGMLAPGERPVVTRALAPVPEDRWPSCGEMVTKLQRVTSNSSQPSAYGQQPRTAK